MSSLSATRELEAKPRKCTLDKVANCLAMVVRNFSLLGQLVSKTRKEIPGARQTIISAVIYAIHSKGGGGSNFPVAFKESLKSFIEYTGLMEHS